MSARQVLFAILIALFPGWIPSLAQKSSGVSFDAFSNIAWNGTKSAPNSSAIFLDTAR